ncbi:hypothetical protein CBS101457_004793 [Exobasidium rhododendri]|nr:hypothetical protein CBS101457_004793 [Exobasidium rhododendri]
MTNRRRFSNALLSPPLSHTLHRSTSVGKSSAPVSGGSSTGEYSSDEDDDILAAHPPIFADLLQAKCRVRSSEDLPDASRANRRPPNYNPPITIPAKSHFGGLAVYQNLVVTGHGGKVRFHSVGTKSIEEVIFHLSAESEKKEIKLAALAFRPGSPLPTGALQDEGRFLWCGTKEGNLLEFDALDPCVTVTRNNVHTAAVVLIERVKDKMISLDESGKICIWLPKRDSAISVAGVGACISLRDAPITQRIVLDKTACAFMVGEQLWVATSVDSNSSSRQQSPRLRMYQPFSEDKPFNAVSRPSSIPESMSWSHIGIVTCGAVIPSLPEVVYVGHQTGHISVWSRSTYTCLSVQTLPVGVTAMAGVREYLWTGDRSGNMSVLNVSCTPWQVVKCWEAHDAAVSLIEIDASSINQGKLQIISSSTEGQVHLWDGLLAKDWLLTALEDREVEYSSYRTINTLHFSYNVDANSPEDFQGQEFPNLTTTFANIEPPDVIVFGLQELVHLDDTKVVAKSFLFGGARRGKGKGIELGDRVSHQYRLWVDYFSEQIRKYATVTYTMILTDNLLGLFTCIFVRDRELGNVKEARIASIKTGFGGRMGNKGAIAASFSIGDTSIALVNCHLAAGQRKVGQRNANLVDVLDSVPFAHRGASGSAEAYAGGGDGSMILDHRVVVLSGDLNYRIELSREHCCELISNRNYSGLLAKDQLYRELRENSAFRLRHFKEAPITFLPTYKYKQNTTDWDPSEKQRVPSYCDRLLWHCRTAGTVTCLEYKRLEYLPSDHRPIQARLALRVKHSEEDKRKRVLQDLKLQWSQVVKIILKEAEDYYQMGTKEAIPVKVAD